MTDLASIIIQLERQRSAIDNAIEALKGVTEQTPTKRRGRPKSIKNSKSDAGRQRQIEAMRAYWAKKKGGGKSASAKRATKKGRLTEAGRRALSEKLKERWAAKRAAGKRA